MSSEDETAGAGGGPPEQLALIRETVRRSAPRAKPRTWRGAKLADELPVARVLVDKGLVHLDQYFDYAVPAAMDAEAQPGVRVRVRFGAGEREGRREGGRLVNGFIVERVAESDFPGALAPLAQVLSTEQVLTPRLRELCRAVADRYAGSLADVVQLAVPPRNAQVEKAASPPAPAVPGPPAPGGWQRYVEGPSFLQALAEGGAPRAVWTALPEGWPEELARTMAATLASGRGALAVLPDGRTARLVDAALTELLGAGHHVLLTADTGPRPRYRSWLAVNRGAVRAVVGTRAAMFAPVRELGLAVLWDDADLAHSDDHAPQPHAREVLQLRAVHERCGFLLGAHGRTVEAQQLVASGWAGELVAPRATVRERTPRVRTVDEADAAQDAGAQTARLPSVAWQTAREALASGPVLVQVPRRGYVPVVACERCREPARCARCAGPLEVTQEGEAPRCRWCGVREEWRCPVCGGARLRGRVFGTVRTAEELGRAFPSVPVRTSGADHLLEEVPAGPALIVSTPGAEPAVRGDAGYAAALLLDGWALLARADLRAGEEALRRWLGAAALVRGAADGGRVVVVADSGQRPVQALTRWDAPGFAARELEERAQLGFPPVSRMAAVSGRPEAVAGLLERAELPPEAEVLGPVPMAVVESHRVRRVGDPPVGEEWERALVRVPPGSGAAMASALKTAQVQRLTRREGPPVQIRVDPLDIG